MIPKDSYGNELVKGFYSDTNGEIYYFFGNYNEFGESRAENSNGFLTIWPHSNVDGWSKIDNIQEYLINIEKSFPWARQKLSELGEENRNSSGVVDLLNLTEKDWEKVEVKRDKK